MPDQGCACPETLLRYYSFCFSVVKLPVSDPDKSESIMRGNAGGTAVVIPQVSHFGPSLTVSTAASAGTSRLAVQKSDGSKRKMKYDVREAGQRCHPSLCHVHDSAGTRNASHSAPTPSV